MSDVSSVRASPREECESTLRTLRATRIAAANLSSEVVVIDRLLARGLELDYVYNELVGQLASHSNPHGANSLGLFFEELLIVATFGNPEAIQRVRADRARLVEINRQISDHAIELAELLSERDEIENRGYFSGDTLFHPVDLIHAASAENPRYEGNIKEKLDQIVSQFDFKYWPTIGDCLGALAIDADRAAPQAQDQVTRAATLGSRGSSADTFRAFLEKLAGYRRQSQGALPPGFHLTDQAVADLLNCALGLDPDEAVDAAYVKRLRQRSREGGRA